MAVEVDLHRLPQCVGDVVEHLPGGIGFGVVGDVKTKWHVAIAMELF